MTYSQCHEDKDSHSMLASMINYILVHKKNKELRLGDITSGEEINNNSDDQTNSEDNRDEFEGFQVLQPRKHY